MCRRMARYHAAYARDWTEYAALSEQGVTFIANHADGEVVLHRHSGRPLVRADAKGAEEDDRECARIAAICRARAAYHEQLKQKWLRAERHPWESLAPDPPPAFPIKDTAIKYGPY